MRYVIETVWFFLPAFFANQCPGFAKALRLPATVPVSERWLGKNKTWSAYYAAMLGATAVTLLQDTLGRNVQAEYGIVHFGSLWSVVVFGMLCGLGAVLGDHTESFVKRQMGKPPGHSWWPWDQINFALGALACIYLYVGAIEWGRVGVILLVAVVFHPVVNYVGYRLGLRERVL